MIKIIKHGDTYKKLKCEECGCEYIFSDNETYLSENYGERHYYVKCPECGYPNDRIEAVKVGETDEG